MENNIFNIGKKVGEVTIKGLAYEDIVAILSNNKYVTKVITNPNIGDYNTVKHTIKIYESSLQEERGFDF